MKYIKKIRYLINKKFHGYGAASLVIVGTTVISITVNLAIRFYDSYDFTSKTIIDEQNANFYELISNTALKYISKNARINNIEDSSISISLSTLKKRGFLSKNIIGSDLFSKKPKVYLRIKNKKIFYVVVSSLNFDEIKKKETEIILSEEKRLKYKDTLIYIAYNSIIKEGDIYLKNYSLDNSVNIYQDLDLNNNSIKNINEIVTSNGLSLLNIINDTTLLKHKESKKQLNAGIKINSDQTCKGDEKETTLFLNRASKDNLILKKCILK